MRLLLLPLLPAPLPLLLLLPLSPPIVLSLLRLRYCLCAVGGCASLH
jgi:hypothetical protein